jgi:hypothetical protein
MKKGQRAPNLDVVVRFLLQHYKIPTKRDVDKLLSRMDQLEAAVKKAGISTRTTREGGKGKALGKKRRLVKGQTRLTDKDKVLSIIKRTPKGIDVARLKTKSGFEDKKIRNIVFRLSREGLIKRVGRGIYAAR